MFLEAYERAAAAGAEEVLSIHLSGEVSGTYESAQLAARDAPVPVHTVDTRQLGMAVGFAVLTRRGRARRGRLCGEAADAALAPLPRRPRRCSTSTPWSTCAAAAGSVPPRRCSARPCR